jgi:ABC-type methionine transport system ATPase subunit
MVKKSRETCSRFKMTFPEVMLGDPVIHKLSSQFKVVPNILRGRITEKSGWLEIELVGAASGIERALKFLAEKGVTIQKL